MLDPISKPATPDHAKLLALMELPDRRWPCDVEYLYHLTSSETTDLT